MPLGLTTEVPLSVPTWKPGAGGVRPTVRVPGVMTGGGGGALGAGRRGHQADGEHAHDQR